MSRIEDLRFDERGLLPVVAQASGSGEVLMLAYANRLAIERTLETGRAHYWSRSRGELWEKGATSGHAQEVVEVRTDCDDDAVLYVVRQAGPACHTLEPSCFHRAVDGQVAGETGGGPDVAPLGPAAILNRVEYVVGRRAEQRPQGSYTTYLLDAGLDKVLKKIGEEATEVVIAAKNGDAPQLASEVADLLFHLVVLMREREVPLEDVWSELEGRFGGPARLPRAVSARHTHT